MTVWYANATIANRKFASWYYAEYFAYWLSNHGDVKKAEQMQQLTPKTYEYFTELAANNWALPAMKVTKWKPPTH